LDASIGRMEAYAIRVMKRKGFNIIEIVIVLSIIAILSAIALPRAAGFIDAMEVRGAVTEIDALFSLARHVAIGRAVQSTLDIDPARGVIAVRIGPDTMMKRELETAHGVTLQSTRASITYSQTGIGYGAANLTLIVTRNLAADTIFVSRLGRVRH
jgi:prepilin-type N-terminal cleavage/methylation domain-containing protein